MTIRGILEYPASRLSMSQYTDLRNWVVEQFGPGIRVVSGDSESYRFIPIQENTTVRQQYKMAALKGMRIPVGPTYGGWNDALVSESAARYADAMIAEDEKKAGQDAKA